MRAPVDLDPNTIAAALAPQLDRLATPALVIDLDAVDHNIAAMLRRAGDRWRPHLKTLKSSALLARLLAAGVTRCKVATLDELDLALATADAHAVALDVLLAYPQHPAALRAALTRAAASPNCQVHFLLDSPEHAALLAHAVPVAAPLAVFLDVDLGMNRTGATAAVWRPALPALLADPGLRITGLHGYEGHLEWDDHAGAAAAHDELCDWPAIWPASWPPNWPASARTRPSRSSPPARTATPPRSATPASPAVRGSTASRPAPWSSPTCTAAPRWPTSACARPS
jgi:D-serine deaminase-like pyridoxal phosphate-dependent protein